MCNSSRFTSCGARQTNAESTGAMAQTRQGRVSEKRDRFGECPDRIPIGPGFAHVLRGVSLY